MQIGRGEILQYVSVGKTEVGDGRMMARARRNEGERRLASWIAGRAWRAWRLLWNDKSGQTGCDNEEQNGQRTGVAPEPPMGQQADDSKEWWWARRLLR